MDHRRGVHVDAAWVYWALWLCSVPCSWSHLASLGCQAVALLLYNFLDLSCYSCDSVSSKLNYDGNNLYVIIFGFFGSPLDVSVIKSSCWPLWGPGFDSQQPHGSSHLTCNFSSRIFNLCCRYHTYDIHTYIHAGKTLVRIKTKSKSQVRYLWHSIELTSVWLICLKCNHHVVKSIPSVWSQIILIAPVGVPGTCWQSPLFSFL